METQILAYYIQCEAHNKNKAWKDFKSEKILQMDGSSAWLTVQYLQFNSEIRMGTNHVTNCADLDKKNGSGLVLSILYTIDPAGN